MTIRAHRCKEFGSIDGPGKHHPSEHIHNPHLADADYCIGCLKRILFVQHATMLGMDWIAVTYFREWP